MPRLRRSLHALACLILLASVCTAAPKELALRGEYVLAPPEYRLDTWKPYIDRLAANGKNFVYFWGSAFFHSKRYPEALFYRDRKGNYLSHDEIRELVRYAHSKGVKFYMAVGGFAWLTMDTLAEQHPETRATGSQGMCPTNPKAHEVNVNWVEELYQTFPEMDGVMVELRDEYGPCNCSICRTRVDKYGSLKYGQGELQLLRELAERLWKIRKDAEIVVCIGYSEHRSHRNDVAFYEGIKELGRDRRWIWLEVRDHWELPAAGGKMQPLRYFSPRVVSWYQPEYHTAGDMAEWIRRASREQLEGVCLGREVGSWSLLYGIRQGKAYLAHTLRMDLGEFVFGTMSRNLELPDEELQRLAAAHFFGEQAGRTEADSLSYLDDLELRMAKGLGPSGSYYDAKPDALRQRFESAVASSVVLKNSEWAEVFERTRAIQAAALLEGHHVRTLAGSARAWEHRVAGETADRFHLVQRELDYLAQLLMLNDSDASLVARINSTAATHVTAARRRVHATTQAGLTTNSALSLFDGDLKTNWLCRNAVAGPQSVTVEFPAAKHVERVSISQSHEQPAYTTDRYRIEGSLDGYSFETLVEGRLPAESNATQVHEVNVRARFIRIVALSIHPNAPYSSPALSEVDILADGKPIREWLRE